MEEKQKKTIDCMRCVYFAITWDHKFPRACKLFGFKSSGIPADTVYKSSGAVCDGFTQKKEQKK